MLWTVLVTFALAAGWAAPAFGTPTLEVLTTGTLSVDPDSATMKASGRNFVISVQGEEFAALLYPRCTPCPPGSVVNLSVGWIDDLDLVVVFTLAGSHQGAPDSAPTLQVVAASVRLPALGPPFSVVVPFTLTLIEDATVAPPFQGLVATGHGLATARFESDGVGWQLIDVVYTLVSNTRGFEDGRKGRAR
jgi:hypothetical protein